jgi:hypothetical protein
MVNPSVVSFLAIFSQFPHHNSLTSAALEEYDPAKSRRPIDLFEQESIIGDPADGVDDPVSLWKLVWPR